MKHAATVLAVVRLHQVVSAVLKVALQVDSMARRVAMVLPRHNSMEASRVDKAGTVVHHHHSHSMVASSSSMEVSNSSMEVSSSSTEVEDMVSHHHSLLVTRCDREGLEMVSSRHAKAVDALSKWEEPLALLLIAACSIVRRKDSSYINTQPVHTSASISKTSSQWCFHKFRVQCCNRRSSGQA